MTKLTGMMEKNAALFSGKFTEYITPKPLYDKLDAEFKFVLDPCTNDDNPLNIPIIFTEKEDGLKQSWQFSINGMTSVYVNPPYGSKAIEWVKKSYEESLKGATVVMMLAARTDTKWFHTYVWNGNKSHDNVEVRFLRGRLKFEGKYNAGSNTAPFPSVIVIFRPPPQNE